MKETEVEKLVVEDAEERGMLVLKLNGPGNRGKPDRCFYWMGRAMVIEFKAPGKKPTELQKKWLREFTGVGVPAHSCDNVQRGYLLLDRFEKGRL